MARFQIDLKTLFFATIWFALAAALEAFLQHSRPDGVVLILAFFGSVAAVGAGIAQLFGRPGRGAVIGSFCLPLLASNVRAVQMWTGGLTAIVVILAAYGAVAVVGAAVGELFGRPGRGALLAVAGFMLVGCVASFFMLALNLPSYLLK